MSFSAAAWRRKTFRKHNLHKNPSRQGRIFSVCQKTYPAESFGGKNSVKGNRQGSLSRSITRRSDQNCKIILQILILQFCRQLVKKVQKDFFDKLCKTGAPMVRRFCFSSCPCVRAGRQTAAPQRRLRRNVQEIAAVIKARAVAGTVPAFLVRVPFQPAAEVRTGKVHRIVFRF